MGVRAAFSTNTKTTSDTKPENKLPTTLGCFQPKLADSRNPYTSAAKPSVAIPAPHQSTRLALTLRDSDTCQSEITRTRAARGILMKNIQCHEACSISHPPRTGPR